MYSNKSNLIEIKDWCVFVHACVVYKYKKMLSITALCIPGLVAINFHLFSAI